MSFEIQPVTEPENGASIRNQGRTRAHPRGLLIFLCLLCFPPRRFSSQGRRPQNGSASTGKLNYFSVRCGNRSNEMGFRGCLAAKQNHQPRRAPSITKDFTGEPCLRGTSCPSWLSFCASSLPVRKFRRISWRIQTMLKRYSYRFVLPARAGPVRLRPNQEVIHEERRPDRFPTRPTCKKSGTAGPRSIPQTPPSITRPVRTCSSTSLR